MILVLITVLVLLLIIGLTYFGLRYYVSEGFENLLEVETPFIKDQQVVYTNYPMEILTNPGVNDMKTALVVPDIFLNMGAVDTNTMSERLVADPTNGFTDYDNKFCRRALMPANLPKHLRGARDGCGWWYVEEPSLTSTGVLGTQNGPIFTDGLPNGGVWIWDLAKAQELEEIKACRQIKECQLIDVDAVHLRCGFCPTTGYAVPINTDGTEKYLDNVNATCGVSVIINGSDCVSVGKIPVVASDGTSCQDYGRPSTDRKLRLYNQEECDDLNGDLKYDGQCLSKIGGNYSEDCADLNKPAVGACTPDSRGRLTGDCLVSIMKGLGYTVRGALLRIVMNGGRLEMNDRVAMAQLEDVGVKIPDTILSGGGSGTRDGGNIDKNTAANLYMRIKEQIRIGVSTRIREAAKWLVVGTSDFDPCTFDANETGPFPLTCIQQLWRMSGCQPAGTDYPANLKMAEAYNGMTWGQLTDLFKNKYNAMNDASNRNSQADSIMKCLGISVQQEPGISCVANK